MYYNRPMQPEVEGMGTEGQARLDLVKYPNGLWVATAHLEVGPKEFPVFDWREDSHKMDIARRIAAGQVGVVFGIGNYGVVKAIADPRRGRDYDSGEPFFEAKMGRQRHSKIPVYAPPKNWSRYFDRQKVRPGFREFFTRERLERFYKKAIIGHFLLPAYDKDPSLDPIFVSTLDDWTRAGKNPELGVKEGIVSLFWWNDPDAAEVADLVARIDPTMTVGISSFNDHGEPPAYNVAEVLDYVRKKKRVPFHFVVRDSVGEAVSVGSSHPQFRPPMVGQDPAWTIVREGSVSNQKFMAATELPFEGRANAATTLADRNQPKGKNLDSLVEEVDRRVWENWRERRQARTHKFF